MQSKALLRKGSAWIAVILLIGMTVSALSYTNAIGHNQHIEEMEDKATRYAVLDPNSQVLFESNNADVEFQPVGSLRNLMIAYIATNELSLSKKVTVGDEIEGLPKSVITVGLEKGDEVTVKDLITCMMLGGAQDAALVLGANLADSVEDLVKNMNETAAALGMENTIYAVSSEEESERTTLNDLLILGVEAMYNGNRLDEILSLGTTELDQTDNHLPEDISSRIHLLVPNEAVYDERVTAGLGIGSSKLELNMMFFAKIDDQEMLIAMSSNLSSTRTFRAVTSLLDLLEEQPYIQADCTDTFEQLLMDLEDEGNILEPDLSEKQLLFMPQKMENELDANQFEISLIEKTGTSTVGEQYAMADISFNGEVTASLPMMFKTLTPEAQEEAKQATILETERYTQADETYFPTTYDQYGWIFWSAAAVVMSVIVGLISSKILQAVC